MNRDVRPHTRIRLVDAVIHEYRRDETHAQRGEDTQPQLPVAVDDPLLVKAHRVEAFPASENRHPRDQVPWDEEVHRMRLASDVDSEQTELRKGAAGLVDVARIAVDRVQLRMASQLRHQPVDPVRMHHVV